MQDRSLSQRLEEKCIEQGIRLTDHRRVILRVLANSQDHPDVEQVHDRVCQEDPSISMPTVYRTLKLLEEAGILEKHDFREGRARYEEALSDHHDHLVDLRTGKVIEFQNDAIEKLQQEVARQLGYRLIDHRLELYGLPIAKDDL